MANFTALAAAIFAALLIANTYAYHHTVTTVEVDENDLDRYDHPGSQQSRERGRQQYQYQQLRHCEQYLRQQQRQGGRYELIMMLGIESSQQLQQCCQELRRLDSQRRCDALRDVVERQYDEDEDEEYEEQGPWGRRQSRQGQYGGRSWDDERERQWGRQGRWGSGGQQQQRRQLLQRARELPNICRVGPQRCDF